MVSFNKVRILSRKSDLAIIQAKEIGNILQKKNTNLKIEYILKSTSGDKDLNTPLSEMPTPGVFTDDLRNELINKKCDIVVHSWKDLPLDTGSKTFIAATLKRADQRDILFVKKKNILKIKKNKSISILSSAPRRIYNLESFARGYLPFEINRVDFKNIRGNIPTRFDKFINGSDDGFVVAKAALDRLLINDIKKYIPLSKLINSYIDKCYWTITPLSINPTSPGQGALACEVRTEDTFIRKIMEEINNKDDYECVKKEREILKKYGGGCHQKIGVSFFNMPFGLIKSEKGETDSGDSFYSWEIKGNDVLKEKVSKNEVYPYSLKDYKLFSRVELKESIHSINSLRKYCILIARNNSLPNEAKIDESNIVWTSGLNTWKSLSKRGIWVNGSSDGMGENSKTRTESLITNPWIKLTHADAPKSKITKMIPTYKLLELPITDNINDKKHFFWMSSSAFKYVNKTFPNIIDANHYCGPGNTYEEIKKIIKDPNKLRIALSYKDWKKNLLND